MSSDEFLKNRETFLRLLKDHDPETIKWVLQNEDVQALAANMWAEQATYPDSDSRVYGYLGD